VRQKCVADGEQVDIPAPAYNRYYQSRNAGGYIAGIIGFPSKLVASFCRQIRRDV